MCLCAEAPGKRDMAKSSHPAHSFLSGFNISVLCEHSFVMPSPCARLAVACSPAFNAISFFPVTFARTTGSARPAHKGRSSLSENETASHLGRHLKKSLLSGKSCMQSFAQAFLLIDKRLFLSQSQGYPTVTSGHSLLRGQFKSGAQAKQVSRQNMFCHTDKLNRLSASAGCKPAVPDLPQQRL